MKVPQWPLLGAAAANVALCVYDLTRMHAGYRPHWELCAAVINASSALWCIWVYVRIQLDYYSMNPWNPLKWKDIEAYRERKRAAEALQRTPRGRDP